MSYYKPLEQESTSTSKNYFSGSRNRVLFKKEEISQLLAASYVSGMAGFPDLGRHMLNSYRSDVQRIFHVLQETVGREGAEEVHR